MSTLRLRYGLMTFQAFIDAWAADTGMTPEQAGKNRRHRIRKAADAGDQLVLDWLASGDKQNRDHRTYPDVPGEMVAILRDL